MNHYERLNEMRNEYTEILDTLCADYDFAKAIFASYSGDSVRCNWPEDEKAACDLGLRYGGGATRMMIHKVGLPYVIKFAIEPKFDCDFCADEINTYKQADAAGVADIFAWCEFLMDYTFSDEGRRRTVKVMIMEECECYEDNISGDSFNYHYNKFCKENDLEDCDESREEFYDEAPDADCDDAILSYAVFTVGFSDKEQAQLLEVLDACGVNDLHCGNWGYIGDRLVMVDYAGYGRKGDRDSYHEIW